MAEFLVRKGDHYRDFQLVKYTPIEELQMTLRELIHLPSGAQVMHLENDDSENLFCLCFRTLPKSSNGAAHILEHTVLCGSRRFPIKDPFFSMSRRSLNTFMNALTGSDFTCYPAATQVEKDFYNLLDVYLDAVFHPLLKEMSFLQEGHRLAFIKPEDPNSGLEIKGIVYNEMKGSFSSVDGYLWHQLMAQLVPDLPYAYNSGGDPREIPKLTYSQLIEFYETHYHPSRCLFFFYGNLALQKHLDFISEKALSTVQRMTPLPGIPLQKRFTQPRFLKLPYPLSDPKDLNKKFIHSFGWLTVPVIKQEEVLALGVLDSVLMDTDASLLRKALLESKLCLQADSYFDTEMSEAPYVIFCRGCKEEDGSALKDLLFHTLTKIAQEGIPFSHVEAAIHQLELSRLEIGSDQTPFGLVLFMRSALAKQHGCAPEQALIAYSLFSKLLEEAKDPFYLSALIEKYLLKNPHLVSITFTPDSAFIAKEDEAEKKRLEALKERLTQGEVAKILQQAQDLTSYQKQIEEQKIDCLPKVTLEDVPKEARHFSLNRYQLKELEVYHCNAFTNQILYVDLLFDLPALEYEELFLLQLFITLWSEVGAGKRNYRQNLEAIHAHTGGLSAHTSLYVQAADSKKVRPALQLRGKALRRKLPEFFRLLKEMIEKPRFDEKRRLGELIRKLANSMQSRLTHAAMRYASQLAASALTVPGYIHERWHGLSFYQELQQLSNHLSQKMPRLMEKLEELKTKLLSIPHPHLVLSCDEGLFSEVEKHAYFGLSDLPSRPFQPWKNDYSLPTLSSQARLISSSVACTAYAFPVVSYGHSAAPALLVATALLENKILHHRIREQGGAYSAGANYNSLWGHFSFYSYRDPYLAHTIHTFHHAIDEMAQGNFDERDLEEAKLSIIQHIDLPTAPGSRAIVAYTWQRDGKTNAMRQHFRDRLLALTKGELQDALRAHLLPQKEKGILVTFAGQALLDKENSLLSPPIKIFSI